MHLFPNLMYACHVQLTKTASPMQAAAKIKEELEQMVKEKSDKFDTMFSEETEKIRLDESGWKSR